MEGLLVIIRNGCLPQLPCSTVKMARSVGTGDVQRVGKEVPNVNGHPRLYFDKIASAALERRSICKDPAESANVSTVVYDTMCTLIS